MQVTRIEREFNGKKLILETGKIAKQAHGALTVQYGNTVVLATALSAPSQRDIDFFPLYVDYREMQYAGGKFPGGFFKREGRPSTKEILACRLIDRAIRPLFPEDFADEVQVQCMVIAADKQQDSDVLALIGSSAALALSHAPYGGDFGPAAAVRVGQVGGKMVLFPSFAERNEGDFEMVVAGHKDAINMLEFQGKEVSNAVATEACAMGLEAVKQIAAMITELAAKAGRAKTYQSQPLPQELVDLVTSKLGTKITKTKQITAKTERNDAMNVLRDALVAELCPVDVAEPKYTPAQVREAFTKVEAKMQRKLIVKGIRPDGRKIDQVRPIWIEAPALPCVHGSAIFSRGETQALAVATLGTPRDQQKIDGLHEEYSKRFMLHYNFPPFSVGEIRPVRGPGRRDIGHGALAEKSIEPVMPSAEAFPYTVRVVSEILESNGSSSMATVCSASLALMDAGVPISSPVAGISIGLVREDGHRILLTDIIGEEDYYGEMDFKVAGTRAGITGIQLDVKPACGIDMDIVRDALVQAHEARMWILDEMAKVLPAPRPQISPNAPCMLTLKIDPEKIGKVIGPGGKTINGLSAKYEVTIDIEEDGTIFVAGPSTDSAQAALAEIQAMTGEIKIGTVYTGKVVGIKDFGAFVELMPGQDGLVHVSELDEKYVKNVTDVVNIGDTVKVKVIAVDDQGRIKLSRKAVMKEEQDKKLEQDKK